MAYFGMLCVPLMMAGILVCGLFRGVHIYDAFLAGAKEGLLTMARIFPALLSLIVAVGMLRASGATELLVRLVRPVTDFLGMPPEAVPLGLMRPLSGSGATAVLSDIFTYHMPDSFVGRCASVMMGSTETTFYTVAVYFGAARITKLRHTLPAALTADLCGMLVSVLLVRLFFGAA